MLTQQQLPSQRWQHNTQLAVPVAKNALQVDRLNEAEYALLPGPEARLRCIDRCRLFEADRVADPGKADLLPKGQGALPDILNSSTNAQLTLKVKPHAQVGAALLGWFVSASKTAFTAGAAVLCTSGCTCGRHMAAPN
jgi:hypothetical protein